MRRVKETKDENGKLHSFNDEPAVIYNYGIKFWYQHGEFHRETDAAIIYYSGRKEYYLNGKEYPFEEWIKLTPLPEEQKLQLILDII
jgi:hypothetical protein